MKQQAEKSAKVNLTVCRPAGTHTARLIVVDNTPLSAFNNDSSIPVDVFSFTSVS